MGSGGRWAVVGQWCWMGGQYLMYDSLVVLVGMNCVFGCVILFFPNHFLRSLSMMLFKKEDRG